MARGTPQSATAENTGSWSGCPRGVPVWVNGATNTDRAPSATALVASAAAATGSVREMWALATSRSDAEQNSASHRFSARQ